MRTFLLLFFSSDSPSDLSHILNRKVKIARTTFESQDMMIPMNHEVTVRPHQETADKDREESNSAPFAFSFFLLRSPLILYIFVNNY